MVDQQLGTANNFSLSGGSLEGQIAVKSVEGLEISVEVTGNSAGCMAQGGNQLQQPRPGAKSYGEPTFVCPLKNNGMELWDWWIIFHPTNGMQGTYEPEELIFTFHGNGGEPMAQWRLIGTFPMKYEVSSGDVENSDLASETIQLCLTDVERML